MGLIVPAVLPQSKFDLTEKLDLFARLKGVKRVQVDTVDGRFARPASWPYTAPQEFEDIRAHRETLPHPHRIAYEADLMVEDAEEAAGKWLAFGATRLVCHAEAIRDLPTFLARIRGRYGHWPDASPGVAIGLALD